MTSDDRQMKSIWFMVGLVLLVMGGLVCVAGVVEFFSPSQRTTVLADTHPGIWWGAIMIVAGLVFYLKNRK